MHRFEQRGSVAELPVVRLGPGLAGQELKLDRGLTLVGHRVADAEESGDGRPPQRRRMSERLAVIGDHVLYGLVVAGRPARN